MHLPLLIFAEYSLNAPRMLPGRSPNVPLERSPNVPPECSPNVPRASLRERRAQREEERLRAVERKVQLLENGSRGTKRGTCLLLLFCIVYYLF
jgi:hypothetical protein